jgi:hypothetical protein
VKISIADSGNGIQHDAEGDDPGGGEVGVVLISNQCTFNYAHLLATIRNVELIYLNIYLKTLDKLKCLEYLNYQYLLR